MSSPVFFNDTAPTEIYTLSLHDALPISIARVEIRRRRVPLGRRFVAGPRKSSPEDRKSTRLNSSHSSISYAVFCLKKKNLPTSLLHQAARSINSVIRLPQRRRHSHCRSR